MDFKWGGWPREVGLNLGGQLQRVNDLSNTSLRDALSGRDPGLREPGIVVELLAPRLRQKKGMPARFLRLRPLLGRGREVLQDAGWERKWMDDERLAYSALCSRELDREREAERTWPIGSYKGRNSRFLG